MTLCDLCQLVTCLFLVCATYDQYLFKNSLIIRNFCSYTVYLLNDLGFKRYQNESSITFEILFKNCWNRELFYCILYVLSDLDLLKMTLSKFYLNPICLLIICQIHHQYLFKTVKIRHFSHSYGTLYMLWVTLTFENDLDPKHHVPRNICDQLWSIMMNLWWKG